MKKTEQKYASWKLFLAGFLLIVGVMLISKLGGKKAAVLEIPNNKGASALAAVGERLCAVFQDGLACVWDWNDLTKQFYQFKLPSDRSIFLSDGRLGAISKTASALFTVYDLMSGKKLKEIRVGSADNEIWPAVSPDGQTILIVRRTAASSMNQYDYEFMTLNLNDELLTVPFVISIIQPAESIVDFTVTDNGIVLAAGIKDVQGRLLAIDLDRGTVLWDRTYDGTQEFSSMVLSLDNTRLYAGNRNGKLYKLSPENGDIIKEITLLQEGETRSVTNDFSVLNLAYSPDGQYLVATITPKAYILRTDSDQVIHSCSPADRLVSKIAFSPDNKFFASSDIRAGYPVKIWKMPEEGR